MSWEYERISKIKQRLLYDIYSGVVANKHGGVMLYVLCVVHLMNHSWSLSPESGGGLLQASGPAQHKLTLSK